MKSYPSIIDDSKFHLWLLGPDLDIEVFFPNMGYPLVGDNLVWKGISYKIVRRKWDLMDHRLILTMEPE
jgi:hypothetical protein